MLRLRWTLALCFWCLLLDHGRADEEAHWGVTPGKGTPTEDKPYSYWWIPVPKIPSLPSLPSLPISIPFYSSTDKKAPDAVNATDKGATDPIDRLQEGSGSGEGGIYEASEPPTVSTRSAASATRTDSLPTETSDSPHGSVAPLHNDALVPGSPTSGSVTSAPFTGSATNAQEQNATHARPPAGHSMGATVQHLPQEHTYTEGFSEKTTVVPETTEAATAFASTRPQPASTRPQPASTQPQPASTRPQPAATRPQPTTANPGSVEALMSTDPMGQSSPSQYTLTPTSQDSTVSLTTEKAKMVETTPTLTTFSEARTVEDQLRVITTTTTTTTATTTQGIDHKGVLESITSTTQSPKVNSPLAGDSPGEEDERDEAGAPPSGAGPPGGSAPDLLTTTAAAAGNADAAPGTAARTEDWLFDPADATLLPDCNSEHTGVCNLSETWGRTTVSDARPAQNATGANRSADADAVPAPSPLMLVPLYTDWNSAMAAWGLAWEAHVYGAGCVFAMVTLASALNLLCLPLRCPSGCGYFALVSLFLLAAGCTRSFSLLYDAYGHQDRLSSNEASLVLYEAPFPCLTAAFGLVFLLLSMRSRMQLSYSAFQRPCFLACLVVLHFAAAFGPVTLLRFYEQKPPFCLFLSLISRGAFVALATFLSAAYFVFYIYVRADSKHIYHLNNTSPTPAERYNRCPFAESRDWDRAALTVCLSALFCLACAGLQLYAMLNALGVAGGEEVFHPWPWWAFQFSCRLCELGVCLTLALVVAQPVYCSDQLPDAGSCWTELLASKSPILPGSYQWTLSQQEKLAIVDTVGLGESESLPLYTLMDERLANSLNGLDLLYHSNRALAYRDLDLDLDLQGSEKPEDGGGGEPSGGSSFTSDSTADLRPPSPINLRRSIDEALFSEALFPMSLFSPARPARCSDISVDNHCASPANGFCDPLSADPGLYRTSSCIEMASKPQNPCTKSQKDTVVGAPPSPSLSTTSSCSSPERWRDSSSSCSLYRTSTGGSSLVLCPSPERQRLQQGGSGHAAAPDQQGSSDPQRPYHTLGAASQESLDLDMSSEADRSVQEEFISVCRQIDALSICSETIDL